MNKAIIMGRLTADPELRFLQDNLCVCSATLAVDRRSKNPDGSRQVDFIRVVFWRQQAEFVAKHLAKGSRIVISGRIQVRNYEDGEGKKRTSTEVVAEDVYFADSKREGDVSGRQSYTPPASRGQSSGHDIIPIPEDNISLPFDLDP